MSKRILRSAGNTAAQTLQTNKNYKLDASGALVEALSIGNDDIVFSGSKSSLRRLADMERNISILAAKSLTEDGSASGFLSTIDYANRAGKWATARTITLGGDLSGNVSIDGSQNVTLTATVAANSVALGTDTTGNYMVNVTAGTGISVSHTQGEGSTATVTLNATTDNVGEGATNLYHTTARARSAVSAGTGISYNSTTGVITNTITQYTDALARGAVSFTAGSGAYNSSTGVITIPTNTNQLTNGAGFITGYTETDTLATVTGRGASTSSAISITNSTESTSKTTGALIVTGGVGIGKNLTVGGGVLTLLDAANPSSSWFIDASTYANANSVFYKNAKHTFTGNMSLGDGVGNTGGLYIGSTAASTSAASGALQVAGGAGIGGRLSVGGGAAVTGAITATGEVTAYFSDKRLKTNIVPIAEALDKVESISGYTFDPNETALALGVEDRHQMGVIAQEIEAVAPELVCDSAFAGYKTVRYDKLTALLIEAVKELSAKVKTLEAKLGDTKPQL